MKTFAPLAALLLALGLACAGGTDSTEDEMTPPPPAAPAPVTVEGEQGQDVVVVPVPEEGAAGTHWCCEYSEGGVTKYALSESKTTCESTYGSKGARWTDGAQCIPCCCKSPNDEGNLDLGYTFGLTTPSACAGSGECVPMGDDTCEMDDEPRPSPRPSSGSVSGSRPGSGGMSGTRKPTPAPAPKDKN